MVLQRPGITNNLEFAVNCFRPILQRLRIRHGGDGHPVLLASFPHLWNMNISKWVITVLRKDLLDPNSRAKFLAQYHKKTGIMECYIILDGIFFTNGKVPNEIRKAISVHEFCHFLALIYASISTTEEVLRDKLRERLAKIVDVLTNEQVLKLYQLLNKTRPFGDEFSDFEQTRDDHFRLNCENLDLSYTDLFKNFLLSKQMFDEYFPEQERKKFFNLLQSEETQEALDLYFSIAGKIAKGKWLTENFARNQAIDILLNFYLLEMRKEMVA